MNSQEKIERKEEKIKKKRDGVKIPAILKQILNKDRSLQKKLLDTSTQDKHNYEKKDW